MKQQPDQRFIQENSDLLRILYLFTRHYKVYLLCVFIALVAAFVYNRFAIPLYRVGANIMILEERPQAGSAEEYINSEMFRMDRSFQNELFVLQSSPLIEQTVKNLDLTISYYFHDRLQWYDAYRKLPIRVLLLKDHVQPVNVRFQLAIHDSRNFTIRAQEREAVFTNLYTEENTYIKRDWSFEESGKFGELIETPDLAFVVKIDSSVRSYYKDIFDYGFEFSTVGSATGQIMRNLDFNVLDRDATVIEIDLRTSSGLKGVDILNELMDVYSLHNVNRKNNIADLTIEYIERQLSEISDSLSRTEDNLQQFRSSRQLIDVSDQAAGLSAQLLTLENQKAELLTLKRYYDYLTQYIQENDDFSNMVVPAAMGVEDEVLNDLVSELISAQTQRSNLIQSGQEKNPLVQRLEIQIRNAKKAISENITASSKTTEISIDELDKRINRIKSEISRVPRTQRQLGGIERNYRLNDAIYNYLLEKRAEANISRASNQPDNIIIEPASIVGIVSPNPRKNYLFAFALGIMIPFGFLFFRSLISEKIEYEGRIDHLTDAPLLGKIPHTNRKTNNLVFEYPTSGVAEAYRALRTNIEYRFKEIMPKMILVSSSTEGEGKSFNALNIAMSYAQLGRKTLLIDFDLRKSTSYFMEVEVSGIGLSSYFMDKVAVDEIIQHSPHKKLDYIPSGPIPPNPVEMLASDEVAELLDQLKEQYHCIVIDSSPLAQVADAYLLLDYADIRIIVVRYNYSLKKIFNTVMTDLREKNIENVCILLNDNKVFREQYGYGYGYGKKKRKWFKI
ncbi:MAG: polysaccharide biosynthesis tyrosine autokinase [Bacteroidales bacterium]|jgi:capsular exopolysaccharide synthesis family protein